MLDLCENFNLANLSNMKIRAVVKQLINSPQGLIYQHKLVINDPQEMLMLLDFLYFRKSERTRVTHLIINCHKQKVKPCVYEGFAPTSKGTMYDRQMVTFSDPVLGSLALSLRGERPGEGGSLENFIREITIEESFPMKDYLKFRGAYKIHPDLFPVASVDGLEQGQGQGCKRSP